MPEPEEGEEEGKNQQIFIPFSKGCDFVEITKIEERSATLFTR